MRIGADSVCRVRYFWGGVRRKECTATPQRSEQQAQALRECDWHNRGSTAGEGNVRVVKLMLKERRKKTAGAASVGEVVHPRLLDGECSLEEVLVSSGNKKICSLKGVQVSHLDQGE